MKKILNEKYKKYLPSKKFVKIMGSSIVVVGVVTLLLFLTSSKENFMKKGGTGLAITDDSILGLIQVDTDGDTIPDWEEALWGTSKDSSVTFDNIPDTTYIKNKKKDLQVEQELNDKTLSETEEFAREFFTAYTALNASGQVDSQTINNLSNALGQKIVDPNLVDKYESKDIKTIEQNSTADKAEYYEKAKALFEKYKVQGLGEELDLVNQGLISYSSTGQPSDSQKLITISNAYRNFAEQMLVLEVPSSLATYHLEIINSSNNLSISVGNMSKVVNDPLVGLSGLSQYEKHSTDLVDAVTKLEETF